MSPQILSVDQGAAKSWPFTLADAFNNPVVAYTTADALSAELWAGDDQQTLATPAASWLDAPNGVLSIAVTQAQTTALIPGFYQVRAFVTPSGQADRNTVVKATLQVLAGPGSAAAIPVYSTLQDLQTYVPQVANVEDLAHDVSGFAAQRGRARSRLDDVILARYRPQAGAPVYGAGGYTPWSSPLGGSDLGPSTWLRQQLDAGALVVRDRTREICSHWAASMVCRGPMPKDGDWAALAAWHEAEADALLKTYRAEVDLTLTWPTNPYVYPSILIHCGATSRR